MVASIKIFPIMYVLYKINLIVISEISSASINYKKLKSKLLLVI